MKTTTESRRYMNEACYECGDEGWVEGDCGDDSCCCADPESEHGLEPCSMCNPEGR